MQGVQRYVVLAYIAVGVILWATLAKLFAAIAYYAHITDYPLLGDSFTVANLLGLVGAGAAGVFAARNEQVTEFCADVIVELRKVTWPSKKETRTATIVVIVCTIVVSLILGFFDMLWAKLTGIIYRN